MRARTMTVRINYSSVMPVTYRSPLWRRQDGWLSIVLACIFLGLAVGLHGQALSGILGAVICLGLGVVFAWRLGIRVTPDQVIFLDVAAGSRKAFRDDIGSIHIYSASVAVFDEFDRTLVEVRRQFTEEQLQSVAELLSVPLYDHRTWLGLWSSDVGREVPPRGTVG